VPALGECSVAMAEQNPINPLLSLGLEAAGRLLREGIGRWQPPAGEEVVTVQVSVNEPEPQAPSSNQDDLAERLSGIAQRLRQLEQQLLP